MIRIGIVGTGIIAAEHARALAQIPDVATLVAAADVVPERLARFLSAHAVARGHPTAAALFADPGIDLVTIATPPAMHEALAVAALEAGKHVFCEKPLAHTLAAARSIAAAESRHPGRLAVSHQLRYDPQWRRLLWLVRNGWIGDIESVSLERHSQLPQTDPKHGGWWGAWATSGGGVLITQLIHELDLLICAAGKPTAVNAVMDTRYTTIESEDHAELQLTLANGAHARVVATVDSPRRGGGITIRGSKGEVGLPWRFAPKDPADQVKALAALDRALPETRGASRSIAARGQRFVRRRLGMTPPSPPSPHALMYADIAAAMRDGRPLPVSPAEALPSLELCAAAYESALTGREVALPLPPTAAAARGLTREDFAARQCPRIAAKPSAAAALPRSPYALRVGFIGLDTGDAPAFASILHDASNPYHIPGARVVAAFPGGSPDMDISASRVGAFTAELRDQHRVQIVDSPEEVADLCDVVFILTADGRLHPAQFRAVAGRGKPVYIGKPFAISGVDADAIRATAEATDTPFFSSSPFRYADPLTRALAATRESGEKIIGCRIDCYMPIQPTQGRYFWFGIHGAEMLAACLGPGAHEVEATDDGGDDRIVVRHASGAVATIVGSQSKRTFGVTLETERRTIEIPLAAALPALPARVLWSALDVLANGRYPRLWSASTAGAVSGRRPGRAFDPTAEETVEIVRLLDAAQRSYQTKQRVSLNATTAPAAHA